MPIILLTGALGNVGSEVATACTERGLSARVAVRSMSRLKERFPHLESVRFDFEDRATWPAALAGCDAVFLLRPPPISDMDATLNPFVDAAFAAGVAHIVFLSVLGADTKRWVPHRKVELHLSASGTAWTVLRPGFFTSARYNSAVFINLPQRARAP
ncbi:MAG: NAD(P)H-binding protein [Gemmatimonadaceae bacterium]